MCRKGNCEGRREERGGVRRGETGSMREVREEMSAEVFDFSDLNIINISVPFLFCKRDD